MPASFTRFLLSVAASVLAAGACAAPPSAAEFARPPAITQALLSPSGQRLALLVPAANGRNRLAVMELTPRQAPRVVASFADANIYRMGWVNDKRLIFEAADESNGVEVAENHAGTFAVNHDGSDQRALIVWRYANNITASQIKSRVLPYRWSWERTIDDGSDDVWVSEVQRDNGGDWTGSLVSRLDTVTGSVRGLSAGAPAHASRWLATPNGQAGVLTTSWDGREKLFWRESSSDPWVLLQDEDRLRGDVFAPLFLQADGQIIVRAYGGRDTPALYLYDPRKRKLVSEPLAALDGFDLTGGLEVDRAIGQAVGLHYLTDRPASVWFDDDLRRIQKSLDAALPAGRSNRISCGRCLSSPYLLVRSSSDTQPGEIYLFQRQDRKLEFIGAERPGLPEASQGRRSFHRVAMRDGLVIPVYVTHPPASKPGQALPAVVLVHGGPWLRGADLMWEQKAQFLASRGYRVIEPEFRGSEGYGRRLFEAGVKQWGRAMQDDLFDALQWAGKEGLADTNRACIMGASYGGYAALMGPIRHPGAYRCAISFAGVADLELRYSVWGSDLSEQGKRYTLPQLVGDPKEDAELLRLASPLLRVAEIKVPVLLVHGEQDRRVPIQHALKFFSAAKAAGVNVQYKLYRLEGHGWTNPANQADFYQQVENFLAQHLKPAAAQP